MSNQKKAESSKGKADAPSSENDDSPAPTDDQDRHADELGEDSTDGQPGDTGDTGTPPGESGQPLDRDSVAALAGQIVSAQIQGIAQYETLSSIWSEFHSTMVSLATLVEEAQGEGEIKERVARLRGELERRRSRIPKPELLDPDGAREIDRLIQSALIRSHRMLAPPSSAGRFIYAEQIFEPYELLSDNQIRKQLEKWEWPDLTGAQSGIDLMTDIDKWFATWMDSHQSSLEEESERTVSTAENRELEILFQAKEICERRNELKARTNSDLTTAADALDSVLRSQPQQYLQEISERLAKLDDRTLVLFLFAHSSPVERYAGRPESRARGEASKKKAKKKKAKKKKSPTRYYRPWGLFRFLRLYGQDPSDTLGQSLNKKLRTETYNRKLDLKVELYPKDFKFGLLRSMAEESFDSHVAEESYENTESGSGDPSDLVGDW